MDEDRERMFAQQQLELARELEKARETIALQQLEIRVLLTTLRRLEQERDASIASQ